MDASILSREFYLALIIMMGFGVVGLILQLQRICRLWNIAGHLLYAAAMFHTACFMWSQQTRLDGFVSNRMSGISVAARGEENGNFEITRVTESAELFTPAGHRIRFDRYDRSRVHATLSPVRGQIGRAGAATRRFAGEHGRYDEAVDGLPTWAEFGSRL